jgi:glycosyltransferase involved in cell wall biosynthesis
MTSVVYDHQIFTFQRVGGVSRYVTELAARIPSVSSLSAQVVAPLHCNQYLAQNALHQVGVSWSGFLRSAARINELAASLAAPLITRHLNPALIHWTWFSPHRPPPHVRTVVTVYDMIHELFPKDFRSDDPTAANKRRCVDSADHVICISESTKRDLQEICGVAESKISVTHLGTSPAFTADTPASTVDRGRPYILYVGARGGYKGFWHLVRALETSPALHNAFDLVAFGGGDFTASELERIGSARVGSMSIRHTAGDDRQLADCYRHARAFVYPSLYEGFGIPPLEAMGCNCPVACTNTSSIPEVVGDAAVLFDPGDVESTRAAVEQVCFDETVRRRMVQAGADRARQFSWDRCARETAAVYRNVLS